MPASTSTANPEFIRRYGNPAEIAATKDLVARLEHFAAELPAQFDRYANVPMGEWTAPNADAFRADFARAGGEAAALREALSATVGKLAADLTAASDALRQVRAAARAVHAAASRTSTALLSAGQNPPANLVAAAESFARVRLAPDDPAWPSVARSLGVAF